MIPIVFQLHLIPGLTPAAVVRSIRIRFALRHLDAEMDAYLDTQVIADETRRLP